MGSPNTRLTLQIDTQITGQQAVDQMNQSVNRIADSLDKFTEKAQGAGSSQPFQAFPAQIKQFAIDPLASTEAMAIRCASSLTGIGVAAGIGVAGLSAFATASMDATRSLAALGVQTEAMSLKTGLTTKEVGQFSFAARAAGGDADLFQTAMRKLSEGLVDGGEQGKKASDALRTLGVQSRTLNGEIRPMGEIFEQIGSQLGNIENPAQRAKLAVDLFGRSGIELIPTLLSLNGHLEKAKELGVGLSDAEMTKLKLYNEELAGLDAKWDILVRKFKEGISGTIAIHFLDREMQVLTPKPNQISRDDIYMTGMGSILDPLVNLVPRAPGLPAEAFRDMANVQGLFAGGSTAADSYRQSRLGTPEGIQARISELQDHIKNLDSQIVPGVSSTFVQGNRGSIASDQREIDGLKDKLKLINSETEKYQKTLEQIKQLNQEGTPFYVVNPGRNQQIVSSQDMAGPMKDRRPARPSLLRPGEFNGTNLTGIFADMANGELTPGQMTGAGASAAFTVNSRSGRDVVPPSLMRPGEIPRGGPVTGPLAEQWRAEDSAKIAQSRDLADRQGRLAGIGENDPMKVASQQLAIRMTELSAERDLYRANASIYDLAVKKLEIDKKAQDAVLDYMTTVAERQAQQKEQFGQFSGSVFEALASRRPNAISDIVRSQVLSLGSTVTENLAKEYVYPAIKQYIPTVSDPNSFLGKAFSKTPFESDPLRSAGVTLSGAGTSLQAAADKLLSVGGFGKSGGSGGWSGGGTSGIFGGSGGGASVFDAGPNGGTDSIPASDWAQFTHIPTDSAAMLKMQSTDSLASALKMPSMGSSSSGFGFNSGTVAGVAAMGAGAFAAAQGFSKGGAGGALQGTSGLLASGAGLASMIPGGQVVALGLGIASAVTGLAGSFFNGPQRRTNDINSELGSNQYIAPTAMNVTQSSGGTFADFDAKGNLRTSNFSPYPQVSEGFVWAQTHGFFGGPTTYRTVPGGQTSQFGAPVVNHNYTIQAMDSESFSDFAKKNSHIFGDSTASAMQDGHGRMTAEVQRAANP